MAERDAQAGFAAALLDPAAPPPPGVIARPGADVGRRFAVYRNNVAVGLIEALRAGFPVTERLVGAEFFRAMARAFAAIEKPSSPMMFAYGGAFPAFIAGFEPAGGLPYLAGVAALEAARIEALHAADAPALDATLIASALSGAATVDWLRLRVGAHPAARLIASDHPIVAIWAAHQDPEGQPLFDGPWQPEAALVTRPDQAVLVRALAPGPAAFAAALLAGATIGAAGEQALSIDGGFDIGRTLIALADAGAMTRLGGHPP